MPMQASNYIKLTGIILAGGKGIRLGRDKGMAKLNGRHLIEYVIDNLSESCDEILVSSNTDQCRKFGLPVIPDHFQGKGPMAGIHACLRASSNEHNFVVSVDTPFVNPAFIQFMLENKGNGLIAAPWYGKDHYEPLCAYYHKDALPVMEAFFEKGNYKLPDVYRALPFTAVPVNDKIPSWHSMMFHNINTEEDLARAEQFLKEKDKI